MFGLGPVEVVLIGALAVMLYGKRLPEVGRSVGQGIAEFRKQWAPIARDLDVAGHLEGRPSKPAIRARRFEDDEPGIASGTPRFDPPPE